MKRTVLLIAWILSVSSVLAQTSEDITWHEAYGTYTIFYIVDGDTLDYSEFAPGNQIDPSVKFELVQDSTLAYHYTVANGMGSRPLQGINKIVLRVDADLDTVLGPDSTWDVTNPRGHFGFGEGAVCSLAKLCGWTEHDRCWRFALGFLDPFPWTAWTFIDQVPGPRFSPKAVRRSQVL